MWTASIYTSDPVTQCSFTSFILLFTRLMRFVRMIMFLICIFVIGSMDFDFPVPEKLSWSTSKFKMDSFGGARSTLFLGHLRCQASQWPMHAILVWQHKGKLIPKALDHVAFPRFRANIVVDDWMVPCSDGGHWHC